MNLKEILNIDYTIIQAPIGGITTIELDASVSNSGTLGGLAPTWSDES